jgi:hypothetical protein
MLQAALVVVQSGANVGDDLVGPPLGRTEALQQRYLTDEIVLLSAGGYTRIGNRRASRRCLVWAKPSQLGQVVTTPASRSAFRWFDSSFLFSASQCVRVDS